MVKHTLFNDNINNEKGYYKNILVSIIITSFLEHYYEKPHYTPF